MSAEPRVCVDRHLPEAHGAGAAALAVALRPDNLHPRLAGLVGGLLGPGRLTGLVGKFWPAHPVIKVRFLDGSRALQARVAKAIEEGPLSTGGWPQAGGVAFDWSNAPDADVRVSFIHDAGSWSYIGTDCRMIARDQPTLNLGWTRDSTPDADFYTALHEFGHALGFGHEHQSPVADIPWDRPAAYAWYQQTQGWSASEVDQQVFQVYSEDQTNHGAYDRLSIMEYPVDEALTLGNFRIDWNKKLSPEDRRFVATIYPKADQPPTPPQPPPPPVTPPLPPPDLGPIVVPDEGPVFGQFARVGDSAELTLRISVAGTYAIRLQPRSDLMVLFGANGIPVAAGRGSIDARLGQGDHRLIVLHPWPTFSGSFGIACRRT